MSAEILINNKTYAGIDEMRVPLADGTGLARFVEAANNPVLNQIFRKVGEYDIGEATNEDGSVTKSVLKNCMDDLRVANGETLYASVAIVPVNSDGITDGDLIFGIRGFASKCATSEQWNFSDSYVASRNSYYGYVRYSNTSPKAAAASTLTQGFDNTKDIELPGSTCTATRATLYLLTLPTTEDFT